MDVALIGPQDLSLGVPGQLDHPLMVETIQKVVDACQRHNVASGIHVRDMKKLLFWKERGMRMLTYSTDAAMLLTTATEAVKELRKHLRQRILLSKDSGTQLLIKGFERLKPDANPT